MLNQINFSGLIKKMTLHICSQNIVFLLSYWPLVYMKVFREACTTRFLIVKKKPKKSEMYRRGGLAQGDKQKIYICRLWSSSSRFDSIELNQVAKILEIMYYKVSTFMQLSQQACFDLFILLSSWSLARKQNLFQFLLQYHSFCIELNQVNFGCSLRLFTYPLFSFGR